MVSPASSVSWSNSNTMWVTMTQMWSDILGTGVDLTKIDRKPNAYLFELWKQL